MIDSRPEEHPRTAIEQRIVDQHTEWMRDHAYGLRMLEATQVVSRAKFGDEQQRRALIEEMGAQIVRDAFRRGLGVIALSAPQYLVLRHLGAWTDPERAITPDGAGWLPAPPPAGLIEQDARVEIKIEAFGFPIGSREV